LLKPSVLLSLAACLMTGALAAQQSPPRLVGTWRLVEFCNVDNPGDTTYSLGRRPIGFFIYDPAGNLSIQAMRASPSGAFMRDSVPLGGMAELRTSYFGYFGTYTITSDSTVVHHVTGGTIPSYLGTDKPRNYRIRGDTLSIGGREPWGCRKLVRVR
jgi:Lipocalin-like domain